MRVFDARKAAEDYMSTHPLGFSTPELILNRFSAWLGDAVTDPANSGEAVLRLSTYITSEEVEPPEVEDVFVPSGAVLHSAFYGQSGTSSKFCAECGNELSATAKFCNQCGTTQD